MTWIFHKAEGDILVERQAEDVAYALKFPLSLTQVLVMPPVMCPGERDSHISMLK